MVIINTITIIINRLSLELAPSPAKSVILIILPLTFSLSGYHISSRNSSLALKSIRNCWVRRESTFLCSPSITFASVLSTTVQGRGLELVALGSCPPTSGGQVCLTGWEVIELAGSVVRRGPCGGPAAGPVRARFSALPFTFLHISISTSENVEGFGKPFPNRNVIPVVISLIFFTSSHLVHYSVKMRWLGLLQPICKRCDGWGCCSQFATMRKRPRESYRCWPRSLSSLNCQTLPLGRHRL